MESVELLTKTVGTFTFPVEHYREGMKDPIGLAKALLARFQIDTDLEPELAYFAHAEVPVQPILDMLYRYRQSHGEDCYLGFVSGKNTEFFHTLRMGRIENETIQLQWQAFYHGPDLV